MSAGVATGQFARLPSGISLHYASSGTPGAPLTMLLHGFPEYWAAWEEVLPGLGEDFFAVAPDLRGFNLSSMPDNVAAYRVHEVMGDALGLAAHLGYDAFNLVGHDWGGAVAWSIAIAMPGRVRRLAILNSPHPVPFARELAGSPAQQAASGYMNWLRAPTAGPMLAENNFARLEGFFDRMQRPDCPWLTAQRRQRYREVWARGIEGGLNYYRASPLYPPTPGDPGACKLRLDPADFIVRVPTLVLWGMADQALLPGLLDGLDELIPRLTVERLPNATHWLIHEEPQLVAARIREFLVSA
jgi:pimeloyl-ACP methyl ester carboxylesterase